MGARVRAIGLAAAIGLSAASLIASELSMFGPSTSVGTWGIWHPGAPVASAEPIAPVPGGQSIGAAVWLARTPGVLLAQDGLEYSGCGGIDAPVQNAAFEQTVVEMTNAERLANGNLPPLKRVAPLTSAARYHSVDMGQDNYFDHDSYDRSGGNLVFTCTWDARVGGYYAGWNAISENIAYGYSSPAAVMTGWMGSQFHRDNILRTTVWEIGAGYALVGNHYWTQDFGRRAGLYPLVINREDESTASAAVQLYLYGSWTEMRLKNENGTFTPWQSFQNNVAWTLSAGPAGTRTVHAEMRTGATTVSAADDINLTVAVPTATPNAPTATSGPTATPTKTATPSATPTIARGDCNADGGVNAADLSALVLETFDGDGNAASNAPQPTFPGHPVGCDANADAKIDAGDLACTVRRVFNAGATCGP